MPYADNSSKVAPSDERLRALQGIVFDCDGVLTDGGLYYDEHGKRLLRFDARDGFGLAMLSKASAFPTAVLSGRPIDIAEHRLRELHVNAFVGRCGNKTAALLTLCETLGIDAAHCGFVGDDIPDLAAFKAAGLRIAVADAAPEIRDAAEWVTVHRGGHGAVREVCEAILKARGEWQRLLENM